MKTISAFGLFIILSLLPLSALEADYSNLKTEAEKFFSDGSYAKAHEIYKKAAALELSKDDKRWVDFRLADTLWRSQAGTQTADSTKFDQAQHQLEVLVRDVQRVEDHDRIWVEVQESLGDFWWTRNNSRNWGQAWPFYQQALDWWAGQRVSDLARDRYLHLVWTVARPPGVETYYYYGYYGNTLPPDVLENVLKIAKNPNDLAHAHYLLAVTLQRYGGDIEQRKRITDEFEAALKSGKSNDWYDDALFNYAQYLESSGRVITDENGNVRFEPDYVRTLELYRQFVKEHKKGESRYYDQAKQQIENITKPTLGVSVSSIFLPDSEIQYNLNWRNVKKIELALYKVDLTRDVLFSKKDESCGQWLQAINLTEREKVKSWTKDTKDKGDYMPGSETLRLDGKLPAGAYVLETKADGISARDLVLVTDASLVVKTSGRQALAYFCNVLNGSPIAKAPVKLWERSYNGSQWVWRQMSKETNADGIVVFDLTTTQNNLEFFTSASLNGRQAFSVGSSYYYGRNEQPWKIYAFTDRPAYRPKETVQWKFIARQYNNSVYSTPANQVIEYEIFDPRGTKLKEDKVTLNAFGSAWGSFDLTETMPLGEYRVNFYDSGRHTSIGGATLFRLEEYKLPEFKVSVKTPEEDGKRKLFRLGDRVTVNVQADYYFGGGVANANVEVLVYQNPFYRYWFQPHPYPWFYEDMSPSRNYYGGQGAIVKRETLKTDATGKASLTFDTPRGAGQDFEYRVEARVTDASRREIIASDNVRVTRQRYSVNLQPEHNIYHPQDKVTVKIKAQDANNQGVAVEGKLKVTRDYWYEIWINPAGKEVKWDEVKAMRSRIGIFPPRPATPDEPGWRLKFRGYQHDEILTRTAKTNAEGEAEFKFTPENDGYYRVAWSSEDKPGPQVQAETTVWVATNATSDIGYMNGGLEIILDKDTFRVGQKAPVMLCTPANDRYVLFSIEGDDLYSCQLVHITGNVKLVEIPIEEKHVPNIFLSAAMVSDRQFFSDTKQVIVPPVENFLKVDVKPDREQYQPREEGTFTITTRNADDKPVSAEIALSLVDESVFYIQQDLAGDPRQFFFGTKRQDYIQTQSTFQFRQYAKLVEGEDKVLMDERQRDQVAFRQNWRGDYLKKSEESEAYDDKDFGRGFSGRKGARAHGMVAQDAVDLPASSEVSALGGAMRETMSRSEGMKQKAAKAPSESTTEPAVQVRSDFRSTVLWKPDLVTDKDGKATVKVKYPDSLTGWKATARVESAANQFGIADATTRTKQPLICRLEAPRFFVVGDKVTISAVVNNNTDKDLNVVANLNPDWPRSEWSVIEPMGAWKGGLSTKEIKVKANSEARWDWQVLAKQPGNVRLKVVAHGDKYSDAMEKDYVVHEHGIEKFISKSGKVRGNAITVKLDIPKERKPASTTLNVQVSPSMAVTMLDALPYLIHYPYGCTEQTMSRFLPAVITAKTLRDLGLKPEEVMGRVFGGIEFKKAPLEKKQDLKKLDDMVEKGLARLYDFQHGDGGWGWWKEGSSDHYMTAYVVWGLTLARDAGVELRGGVLENGVNYLNKEIVEEEENFDQQAWMLYALSSYHASTKAGAVGKFQAKAFDNLWKNRDRLNAYTRALLALSAHQYGYTDKAKTLIENLENGVKEDKTPDTSVVMEGEQESHAGVIGTAHWGEDGIYWRWSEGGIEATAFALRAMLAIDPQNKLIEPVTNWLIKNRRGAQWSNTRDTAFTVLTLNEYLRKSGELKPDFVYELLVNGHLITRLKITAENVFQAPSTFAIDPKFIEDGANEIQIKRKEGKGSIYFAAQAVYFSLEEPIPTTGNEIFVRRQYYKLSGHPTLLKGFTYDREPLNDNETVASGDRVEVVITIEAKNNYEYLLFEDLKPAGLEAVEIKSGENLYANELKTAAVERGARNAERGAGKNAAALSKKSSEETKVARKASSTSKNSAFRASRSALGSSAADFTGRTAWVYQELRDRKVAMFIDKLPEGVWEIHYDLRAEVPGTFHALPVLGHAMYVPEIRCNGSEVRITVVDAER